MREINCKHFGTCGGCSLYDLSYEEQLSKKQENVESYLKHFNVKVNRIIPSVNLKYFRNKMELIFGKESDKTIIGLRQRGKFNKIVNIEECPIMSEKINEILNFMRNWADKNQLEIYNLKSHKGFLRYITIREGKNTGEVMLYLTTTPLQNLEQIEKIKELGTEIKNSLPFISTFIWAVSSRLADVSIGEKEEVIFGEGVIYEQLANYKFKISPTTFFQTNPKTAELMYNYLLSITNKNIKSTILDVYCGAGIISIFLSNHAEKIIGIDSHFKSIEDAKENIKLNNIRNCEFLCVTAEDFLPRLSLSKFSIKLSSVILDPPRPGVHKKAIMSIIKLNPNEIIYISCNIRAFINDFLLLNKFYKIEDVQPIDLFPFTEHIELVIKLKSK